MSPGPLHRLRFDTYLIFSKLALFYPVFRIRIRIRFVSWIRIRIPNAEPDPAADKISSKSQKNSII
jgi:hypothetical protein